ncbi:hypothetical protein ACPV5R_18740 [Vibrio astriarenae]
MELTKSNSSGNRISLNIKIKPDTNERLKKARRVAKENGLRFNVSKTVETFLNEELDALERRLGY